MLQSSRRALPLFVRTLALGAVLLPPTRGAAESLLAGFEGRLPGEVQGSSEGPAVPACTPAALSGAADRPGSFALEVGTAAAQPPEGITMLRLGGKPADGGERAALTRWRLPFDADQPSVLDAEIDFVPAEGAYFVVAVDGRAVACGDESGVRLNATFGVLPAGDSATGWLSLAKGADMRVPAGPHVLEIFVGDTGGGHDGHLLVDAVRLTPQVATPCRPAPPEDVGETTSTLSTPTHWIFDDNRFCAAGPGIGCADVGDDPRPGTQFEDSTDRTFEMYVVADCGTTMHIPLFDVESGCISVSHDEGVGNPRTPILIDVNNGAGFHPPMDTEVCWSATACDGGGGNNPGGPGDARTMDVSFVGNPTLCGVYVVQFRSWAGCYWHLFTNCNGTNSPQFTIYDDICLARAATHPLPELVVENLVPSDAGGCSEHYCVTVHNVGCQGATPFTVHVANQFDSDDVIVPALLSGDSTLVCGDLAVSGTGIIATTVTATVDPANTVLECTEASNASSCSAQSGVNSMSRNQDIDCTQPPTCNAGGPYTAECTAASGGTHVQVDGSGSSQPGGGSITYAWTTDCAGGSFDDASAQRPVLTVTEPQCDTCAVSLTVHNTFGLSSSCSASVTITDTRPPDVSGAFQACLWPPDHRYVCFSMADLQAVAFDACSGAVPVRVAGCVSDQPDDARESDPDSPWNGDGHTTNDCVVSADGLGVCVRSERCGTGPTAQDGRHYGILVQAVDSCGNPSVVAVGTIHVPHDQSPHERDCVNAAHEGIHGSHGPADIRR